MAVAKSLAATCCPVAGEAELSAGALEEQALTPVAATIAVMASTAAASLRDHDRVGFVRMLLAPSVEKRGIRGPGGRP
jgi:hypothetical protein